MLVTATALVATAAVGLVDPRVPAVLAAVVVTVLLLVGRSGAGRHRRAGEPLPGSTARGVRGLREMALHLSPVALLMVVFPLASSRIAETTVGGTGLTSVLLASSLTVPWISQAVCLPLYRGIGHLVLEGDMQKIDRRFCEVWPTTFLQSLPAVVLFTVPVAVVTRWSAGALAVYVGLCVLHVAFAQALVVTNVGRRRERWALAWSAYAAALLVAPTLWFLPALTGLAVQLVPLRHHLLSLRRPARLDHRDVASDLLRGLALGAVLWSDKLLLFFVTGGQFAVQLVFVALLPAVLAYNYYFVRLAPRFDASVAGLRVAMEQDTYSALADRSRRMFDTVTVTVARSGAVGAVLALVLSVGAALAGGQDVRLFAAVAVASWFFMMVTILSYKLDYIGHRLPAQVIGGVHLVACITAFTTTASPAGAYIALTVVEAVLLVVAMRVCFERWRSPEYTLFWRHATAW
ncbi:hypothetical protein [Kineococcus sp. SYSU DK004]|uniref:hypothetical protein n=1 Tax=Kineococcus sp. SYSU DK004 TaxID=3383125 RepID=UPI003D7D8929